MNKALSYLQQITGITVQRGAVSDQVLAKMPNIIRFQYHLEEWRLYGVALTAMEVVGESPSPRELCQHAGIVRDATGTSTVLAFDSLPSYMRLRLAAMQQFFVVADRQVFLPDLMLMTQARARATMAMPTHLSAPAQLFVLSHLQHGVPDDAATGQALARMFGGSTMTWSRALSELVILGVGEETRLQKFRHFRFVAPPRELWTRLQAHLRTPVVKSVHVKCMPGALPSMAAGYSALAQLTDISGPGIPERAVSATTYRSHMTLITPIPWPEPDSTLIQLWRYEPGLLSHDGCVDRLSLYLSLRDDQDERVEKARSQLLEAMQW